MDTEEMSIPPIQPWWTYPEHFDNPLVFYIDEEQEEFIFGPGDVYLPIFEVKTNTLIQLESWFTASGQTRVTVVGPPSSREWLLQMMTVKWNKDFIRRDPMA